MSSKMKTKVWLLFLLITLPGGLFSQRFNGGVLAGGVVSQVDGDGYGGYTKFGYMGGALVSLRVSPHSSFQMELEYIQKGSRINADSLNYGNTYLMRFHYLEVPLLYQYTFARRFSVEAGPAMDVLLGSLEESNGMESPSTIPLRTVTMAGILGISGDGYNGRYSGYLRVHLPPFKIKFQGQLFVVVDTRDGRDLPFDIPVYPLAERPV
jgi:hypothetical protein